VANVLMLAVDFGCSDGSSHALMILAFSFTEQLILNLVGPLVTIILGTLIVGAFASRLARKAQERREDHALRERLITQATEGPIALYLASQHYWRAKRDLSEDQLLPFRGELDKEYVDARAKNLLTRNLLKYHFQGSRAAELAHQIDDLLTVRYFQLREEDGASHGLLAANAGPQHSGLSVKELKSPRRVLQAFHKALNDLAFAVGHDELTVGSRRVTPEVEHAEE
jgi:hypothetical protein